MDIWQDRFLVSRDGHLHDKNYLCPDCGLDPTAPPMLTMNSLEEVASTARSINLKPCFHCGESADVRTFWDERFGWPPDALPPG